MCREMGLCAGVVLLNKGKEKTRVVRRRGFVR